MLQLPGVHAPEVFTCMQQASGRAQQCCLKCGRMLFRRGLNRDAVCCAYDSSYAEIQVIQGDELINWSRTIVNKARVFACVAIDADILLPKVRNFAGSIQFRFHSPTKFRQNLCSSCKIFGRICAANEKNYEPSEYPGLGVGHGSNQLGSRVRTSVLGPYSNVSRQSVKPTACKCGG